MTRNLLLAWAWVGCTPDDGETKTDTGSPATDTTTHSGPPTSTAVPSENDLFFDADHRLVMPDGGGLALVDRDGTITSQATWTELVGSCSQCGGEGATADDDGGLLLTFTLIGAGGTGGVAKLDGGTGALGFRLDGFGFPHDAVRDPLDDTIIVQETSGGRLTWVAGDGSSTTAVRSLTSLNDPDWPGNTPNGLYRFQYEGGTYVLSTHRGGFGGSGEITLWDISDPTPSLVWRFPGDGADLDTPHCPRFRWYRGTWWLTWAHTEGAADGGSVGLATTTDPLERPVYVADLVPPEAVAPFTFFRGVELTTDGELWLTDSGSGGGPGGPGGARGRLLRATMPAGLAPTGASGDVGGDQVFVEMPDAAVIVDTLDNPFEAWLWVPTFEL